MPNEACPLRIWTRWLFLMLLGLGACAAPPSSLSAPGGAAVITPSPAPSPQPLRVRYDSAFEPLQPLLAGCVPPGLAIYFMRPGQPADVNFSWGEPNRPEGLLFTLGSETLVLVVNPTNSLASIKRDVLEQVYAGKYNNWDPLGGKDIPLTPWVYPAGEPIQAILSKALALPNPLPAQVQITPGPRELRAAISADRGGLGYLPRRWVDGAVRVLPIAGGDPAAFTRPLLAETSAPPQGGVKDFLLCVRDGLKTQ